MSDFKRQTMLEDGFNDMWGIKPIISYLRISNNEYKIKLATNEKVIVLTEIMERGLTKSVTLENNGKLTPFKSMYEAEKEATNILRN